MPERNLRVHGKAPFRVAVIHGGPGAAGEMAPVARRLAQTRGVLEPLQTAATVAGQIAELAGTLSHHATAPAVLIGYSWGAWLSLLVAAQHPELAERLVLVSCPAFGDSGAEQLRARRLERLSHAEQAQYQQAVAALHGPAATGGDPMLETLGRLTGKTDAYELIEEAGGSDDVRGNAAIYRAVWKEAAELRRSGALLRRARTVQCPVIAIHGDADPSPAAAVAEPLSAALASFRLATLARCGHTPWRERYAKEEFYRLLAEVV